MADNFSFTQELIRGGITVASVFIGALMAMRTYRSNQWWDARHKAYEKAIDLLNQLDQASVKLWKTHSDEGSHHEPFRQECKRLGDELNAFASKSRFNMSDAVENLLLEASDELDRLLVFEASAFQEEEWDPMVFWHILEDVCEAAKNDLQVSPWHKIILAFIRRVWRQAADCALKDIAPKVRMFVFIFWLGETKGRQLFSQHLQKSEPDSPPILEFEESI